jgi:hypothetical protein
VTLASFVDGSFRLRTARVQASSPGSIHTVTPKHHEHLRNTTNGEEDNVVHFLAIRSFMPSFSSYPHVPWNHAATQK